MEEKAPDSVLVSAWDEFYRIYDNLIRRFAVAQGLSPADIDDCIQEVWGAVVQRLADFQRPADRPGLRAWLYTLVRRKAAAVFRDKYRGHTENIEHARPSSLAAPEERTDPAALLEQKWEQALLESVIHELGQELSGVNYQILQMRLIEDLDVKEVASELSLTSEQVRYRYHRVMRKLRVRLAVFTGEPVDQSKSESG
jgi:RNA polymerase sigma factor (sigma-70 family)